MKIYESAVKKPVSTVLIFIGVIIMGLYSLKNLAIDMYPEMDTPGISVITTYEGANAAEIEVNVTKLLEESLNSVENLDKITSESKDNYSVISLEFTWGSDIAAAANDVRDVVSRMQSFLPDGADFPTIFRFTSSMYPVAILSVEADESYMALNKILDEKLVDVLNRVDGIGSVTSMGAPAREIQVNVDPVKLNSYNLSIEQIGGVIALENVNITGGTVDMGNNTYNIKSDVEFNSSDEIKDIVIASYAGKDVLLKDVATVIDTLERETLDERINGRKGVRVLVQKQSGANTVSIVEEIKATLPKIQKTLPPDITIGMVMDGSESIVDSINSLSDTVMYAFIFVVLVVLFFLGRWRATFIIALTIPVSLIVSFIYLYATGSTLNIISLSALSVAIGMVVDDAIVVLENITKHIERGSSPKEAAIYATNEVWLAVIATTLVIVAVFMPLTMVSGMAGIMFRELGWIVTIVCVLSTVAAISLTPMLSAHMLKADGGVHNYKGVGIIYKPIDKFLDWLDNVYAKLLTWAVRHRTVIIVIALGVFVASMRLVSEVPTEFFPTSDTAAIAADVRLEQNTGVVHTQKIARQIEDIINEKYPEIYMVSSSAGTSSSSSSFSAMSETGSHIITLTMKLTKASTRERSMFVISDLLREEFDNIPDIKEYTVTPGGNEGGGAGGASNIEVKVFGYSFDDSNAVAQELKSKIAAVPGARDVKLSREEMRPEYNIVYDRSRLSYSGLDSYTAGLGVYYRVNGYVASLYREDGDEYDIKVRYAEPFTNSIENIENIILYNNQGNPIKIKEVANVEEVYAPSTISHENRQRVVSVEASLAAGYALGTVAGEVSKIVAAQELPDGITLEVGGTVEDQEESFADLMTLLVLIIILVYIVMATQFESLKMPFIIIFSIPFAFTGVFLALYLTGTALSVIALIGAIMLVGIVVKNGIVIVDFINLLRERGSSINVAVIAAGKSRLRPVLMTSLTTILGMMPLALGVGEGSEIWQPMGIAVIGGLTFSTILTLIVIPVIYSAFGARGLKKTRKQTLKA